MKHITTKERVLKAALITALSGTMGAMALPVNAEEAEGADVTKDESVYIVLNADGSTKDVTVSDQLHSKNGFNNYKDESTLKDVENLKSTDPVQSASNGYVWNSQEKDIFYQGKGSKDLPLKVSITYTLDGKEVPASEMAGKSGHMVMTLHIDNEKAKTYTVNGRTYTISMPFITLAGAMMDGQKFTNVKISSGTVSSDSSHQIAVAVMMPGMRDSLRDIVDPSLMKNLDSYLSDEITIEADVNDFESPNIMMAASTNIEDLKGQMNEINDEGSEDLFAGLDQLESATNELVNGTKSLYDGAVSADEGGKSLSDGAAKLAQGAETLSNGAAKLSAGAGSLESGLGTLSSNSQALNDGAAKIAQAVFDTANNTLHQNEQTKNLPDLTLTNYADVLGALTGADQMRGMALSQIEAAAGVDETTARALIYMAGKNHPNTSWTQESLTSALQEAGEKAKAAQAVQAATASYQSKEDALKDPAVVRVLEGIRAQKLSDVEVPDATAEQMSQVYETIASKVLPVLQAKLASTPYASFANETTANALVTSALHTMASSGMSINEENLTSVLTRAAGTLDASAVQKALQSYRDYQKDPVYAAFAKRAYEGAYKEQYAGVLKNMSGEDLYDQVVSAIESAAGSELDEASAAKLIGYTADHYEASKDLNAQISQNAVLMKQALQVAADMQESASEDGNASVNGILDMLYEGNASYQKVKQLEDSLTGVKTFVDSLKKYTDGVDAAYQGSQELKSGADSLAAGALTLKDGADKLSAGASTLASGLDQLKDGAKTLMDGMQKYNEEGISKLTDSTQFMDIENAADLLEDVRNDGESYNNYSGISEGTEGNVKFIYKVDSVAQKTKEETKDETADAQEEDQTTFLDRVLALFSFK
jgi:putative membrane protein